jgi:hypothetical protein
MSPADTRASRVLCSLAAAWGISLGLAAPTAAQAPEPVSPIQAMTMTAADPDAPPTTPESAGVPPEHSVLSPMVRPRALVPLYSSFAVLQVMDVHSTVTAVHGGAVERNPLMAPLASNAGGMLAVKAATTTATIVLAEKLWRRHPAKAVALMAALNAAFVAIVAANYHQ